MEIDMGMLTPEQIKIGRIQRKLTRALMQRDLYKEKCEHYKEVLDLSPYITSRHEKYTDKLKEMQRVKDLETRVKEQALLIQELQKVL
jgi:ppGpp synthetase/RelA/SpoT-type nucleotidyltranferase